MTTAGDRTGAGAEATPTRAEAAKAAVAGVWAFGRWRKDHLALDDADATLCGVPKNPAGWPTWDRFDPTANYSCKRCVAALRARGPVLVASATGFHAPFRRELVSASPEPKAAGPRSEAPINQTLPPRVSGSGGGPGDDSV